MLKKEAILFNEKNKKIVVIGGGVSGLATAALLGKDGYLVTVLEKKSNLFVGAYLERVFYKYPLSLSLCSQRAVSKKLS